MTEAKLQKQNTKIYRVSADNQCLFNAIAFGMIYLKYTKKKAVEHYKTLAKKLRHYCVKEMEQIVVRNKKLQNKLAMEWIVMQNIHLKDDITKEQTIEFCNQYLSAMRLKHTWGGLPEVLALSNYIHARGFKGIQVYDDEYNKISGFRSKKKKKAKYPYIRLILHGTNMGGVHYDFIAKC